MKFGVCSSPDQAEVMAAIGADFVEWSVSGTVGTASDDDWQALRRAAGALTVVPEAWNGFLPADIRIVGPEVRPNQLREYAARALPRVKDLGGEVVVFGSGRSRTVPDGWEMARAEEQFAEACRVAAEVAVANDLTIALEPLRSEETNLLNRVDEGLRFVERVNQPGFELLADLYHMAEEQEPLANVVPAAAHLAHVHIAAPGSRGVPVEPAATAVLADFFGELKRAGYDRRISFECRSREPEELRRGLAIAREVWAS